MKKDITYITISLLLLITEKPKEFIEELKTLCKKYDKLSKKLILQYDAIGTKGD